LKSEIDPQANTKEQYEQLLFWEQKNKKKITLLKAQE
jgi:hypothetical protein